MILLLLLLLLLLSSSSSSSLMKQICSVICGHARIIRFGRVSEFLCVLVGAPSFGQLTTLSTNDKTIFYVGKELDYQMKVLELV